MFYRGEELRHKIKRQKEWSFIFLHDDTPPQNNHGRGTYSATLVVREMGRATDGWRCKWPACFLYSINLLWHHFFTVQPNAQSIRID